MEVKLLKCLCGVKKKNATKNRLPSLATAEDEITYLPNLQCPHQLAGDLHSLGQELSTVGISED